MIHHIAKLENVLTIFLCFICSYDLRGRGSQKAQHWSDDHVLGKKRAMFFMAPPPVSSSQESLLSVLKIRGIRDSDRGLYRCRVDFKAAPTRNTRANLTVIGNCFIRVIMLTEFYSSLSSLLC